MRQIPWSCRSLDPGREAMLPMLGGCAFGGRRARLERRLCSGAVRSFVNADPALDRHVHTDSAGTSNVQEYWEFRAGNGGVVQQQLQYVCAVPVRSELETMLHSTIRPDFYRIYTGSSKAADLVRSTAKHFDRTQNSCSRRSAAGFCNPNGSEQLMSDTSLPWHWRQVLPQ